MQFGASPALLSALAAFLLTLNSRTTMEEVPPMAAPATGHAATDHLRVTALLEAAFEFACAVLKPGGAFVGKAFKGGSEQELLKRMKQRFASVRHAKPPASRKESAETYVVATGFRR